MKRYPPRATVLTVSATYEGGMVLLSVVGLLLLLSLLASDAATRLSWNTQISRHWTQATSARVAQHQWIVGLYRLDPSSLIGNADSTDCDALTDACIYFTGEDSSADTWYFVVEPVSAQEATPFVRERIRPARISGWLRRRAAQPTQVAAVWVNGEG